jgi:MFS family permease
LKTINRKRELSNLFLYSTGKTVAVFGSSIYSFSVGLYVLKMTGSALSFAITLMLGVLPMILINPVAGVIADKFNKKTLVVSMDMLSGTLMLAVYLLSYLNGLTLWLIYSTTFLLTLCATFFGVAMESSKPNIVSNERLMRLNSISRIIDSISLIMGPMIGGVVFAFFDIRTFILFNSIGYILSGLTLLFIHFHQVHPKIKDKIKIHFMNDIKEGFLYIMEHSKIKNLFMILISLNFFIGFAIMVPLPYIINSVLELSSKEFGLIQGSFPVGIIIGALIVKKLTEKVSYSTLLRGICFILSILMMNFGVPVLLRDFIVEPTLFVTFYCLMMFLYGTVVAVIDIPIAYFMQKEIPEAYRGRVLSIGISIGKTMLPVAMILSGVLLKVVPAAMIPIAGGLLYLLLNIRSAKVDVELSSTKTVLAKS